uniref:Uncharacterized protein n=1 Tax=Anguilla anguilla TaxID=7936 RepID=A0A0E9S5M9_ANGAN
MNYKYVISLHAYYSIKMFIIFLDNVRNDTPYLKRKFYFSLYI